MKNLKSSGSDDDKVFSVYLRLLSYLKPHLIWLVFSFLGFLILAVTQPLLAFLLGYLIDALEGKPPANSSNVLSDDSASASTTNPFSVLSDKLNWSFDWVPTIGSESLSDDLNLIPIFVVFIYFVRGIGMLIGNYAIARVAQGVVHNLRTEVFNKMTSLPGVYFDRHDSGTLVSKITFNVAQVTVAVTDALKIYLREGLSVLTIIIVLVIISPKLTLMFLVVAPLVGFVVSKASKRMRAISHRIQNAMGAITSISSEMINGYRVMRIFGGEKYERDRFDKVSRFTRNQNIKIALTHSFGVSLNQFIVAVLLGVLMYVALFMINTDGASDIMVYMLMVGFLPKSLRQLSDVYSKVQRAIAAAQSIFEHLDEADEIDEGNYHCERARGKIELQHLSFTYANADMPALDDVSLTIAPGTTVALVGKSGSGKSTLVNLIPRYYDHNQGKILLDDREINEYTLKSLRQQIALVTQNVVLFNDTVRANIAYGDLANKSEQEVKAAADNAYATEFIEKLPRGFDTEIGEDGDRLSGGQRQRLSIARALLKNAPVLILDEATSALDTESERLIQSALDNIMRDRTTLVIAHRLSTIERADKIVVMEKGKIVEQGRHDELIALNGAYAKLHAMQFKDEATPMAEALD